MRIRDFHDFDFQQVDTLSHLEFSHLPIPLLKCFCWVREILSANRKQEELMDLEAFSIRETL